jgi:hypothetical protein
MNQPLVVLVCRELEICLPLSLIPDLYLLLELLTNLYKAQCYQEIFAVDEESRTALCYEMKERSSNGRH